MLLSQESKTTNMQKVNLISPTIKHILQIGANLLFALILCCFFVPAAYCQKIKVSHLTTELIEETDIVYSNGFPTDKAISEYDWDNKDLQIAHINTPLPHFSWQIESNKKKIKQLKYRILVATSPDLLTEGNADIWDSGIVEDSISTGVIFGGDSLKTKSVYYWTAKNFYKPNKATNYSAPKGFVTPATFSKVFSKQPLVKTRQTPVAIQKQDSSFFMDFGKDAFGQIEIKLGQLSENQNLKLLLGEKCKENAVDKSPGATIRYAEYKIYPAQIKDSIYHPQLLKDPINTGQGNNASGVNSILMPDYIGEVLPFRYCGLEGYNGEIADSDAVRIAVNHPFNDNVSSFSSSDTILNQVWDLCKYSMKATSFSGFFVDGDRERIPYEGDALINQLTYYCVDNHYSIARVTAEHLIKNPTWPTEWILETLLIAWNDYMYTGDDSFIKKYYNDLKNKTLYYMQNSKDHLLHTGIPITKTADKQKVYFKGGEIQDIIDWPSHERDSYTIKNCNTVVNVLHYKALDILSQIALTIGNQEEHEQYKKAAQLTKHSIDSLMHNESGLYIDATDSKHCSLHANMFPLAFGMVEEQHSDTIKKFIKSKGMACSVYGAQFLLDAVFDNGMEDYGLSLLTSTEKRSWYNMIQTGSTITTEAWDTEYKSNQDWNHAWGAAAGNIIVRKLMGIEPLAPGFSEISIAPKPSNLKEASVTVPTPHGAVSLSFTNTETLFYAVINVPPNTTAQITLPFGGKKINVQSGKHIFKVIKTKDSKQDLVTL